MQHASAPAGSDALVDCVCGAGYYETGSAVCSTCVADHFCPGDDAMYACPANSTAPAQADAEEDCVCSAGFKKDAA